MTSFILLLERSATSAQGQWSKWRGYIKRDVSWHNLLNSTPRLVLFCLVATCNILASPQNGARWGFEDDIDCALCGKEEASVGHILAGCQKALQSGRYTFRHNAVMRVIVHEIQFMINRVKKEVGKVCKISIITFLKEGEQRKASSRKYKSGFLHEAIAWVIEVNIDQQLRLLLIDKYVW